MDPESFTRSLAMRIRDEVAPLMGRAEARRRTGTAAGGDPTFSIDVEAERLAEEALEERGDIAYFTEDAGLRVPGRPEALVLLDPVDGSRPAAAGFETCCVAAAVAPWQDAPRIADLTYGVIVEIATGATFEARRGGGALATGARMEPAAATDPSALFWAGGFRGQPAVPTTTVLAELFDAPGAEGAFFDQGSAAYSLSRVATGQLDAYVDPGQAILETVPEMEDAWRRVGGGHVLNTTTYDTAAGFLLLRELGCPVTDAVGRPVEEIPLFDRDGAATLVSTIAACTAELHAALVERVAAGIERLRHRRDRREPPGAEP